MHKLSRKFTIGITIILVLSVGCSILFNTKFLEKYYLYQKRVVINDMCEKLTGNIHEKNSADEAVRQIERSDKVIIARVENSTDKNNEEINDIIRSAFQDKGVGFQKYWLWKGDYEEIMDGQNRVRLYRQEKLNYSLLVEYTQSDGELFAVAMIIPDISDAFGIIHTFLILVNAAAVIIAMIFIIILIKRITRPLRQFENFASHMKNGELIPLEVHTKDELERVADSLNSMGVQMIAYQKSLQEKNGQMEQLLDNVSHDLKTPISLVQLYADGMRDGLDDGTFLDTIIQQNGQMADMVNQLLYTLRIEKKEEESAAVHITSLLGQLVEEYEVLAREQNMTIVACLESQITVIGSSGLLESLFTNLITNAIKYSSGPQIDLKLFTDSGGALLSVTNETDNTGLDLSKIWDPYYVGEQSRNKNISGTGLGLAIVDRICKKMQYSIECSFEESQITFLLMMPAIDTAADCNIKSAVP